MLHFERTELVVHTSHHALKCMPDLADTTERLARWSLCLSEFDFKVAQRARILRQAVEVL